MSNALNFLTRMGSSARLRGLSREALIEEMSAAGLSAALQQAVLRQDRAELVRQLKTSGDVVCMVMLDVPDDHEVSPSDLPQAVNG